MTPFQRILRALDTPRAPLTLFLLALAVRLLLLAFLHDSYYTSGMAQGELGRNLAEGRGFVLNGPFGDSINVAQWNEERLIDVGEGLERFPADDSAENLRPFIAYMMPGQGILLAGTYLITGWYSYLPLQVLQACVDALGVFLIVGIGTALFDRRVGVAAAFLYAMYIPEARLAITATRDAWMPILYLASAYCTVMAWKKRRTLDFALLALVVSVAAYFRSEVMLLTVWVGIFLWIAGLPLRSLLPRVGLSIAIIILAILPWTVRNARVFDRLIPTNSGLWVAMWQSFGEYENDFGAVNNDMKTLAQMRAEGHQEAFDTPEYDALFRPKVMKVFREEPAWVAWTMARRLARIPFQMHAWGISATDDLHGKSTPYPTGIVAQSAYWRLLVSDPWRLAVNSVTRGINAILYLAALVWFFVGGRRDWRAGLVLLSIPLYNILVHAVIGVHARYILPTNAVFLPFLAMLILECLSKNRAGAVTGYKR